MGSSRRSSHRLPSVACTPPSDSFPYPFLSRDHQIAVGSLTKYLLNGHKSTLETVQKLFQSVQLNINNPNFLIMQGKITKVLNMKPQEILGMVEEASGTRMFEERKEKAVVQMGKKDKTLVELQSVSTLLNRRCYAKMGNKGLTCGRSRSTADGRRDCAQAGRAPCGEAVIPRVPEGDLGARKTRQTRQGRRVDGGHKEGEEGRPGSDSKEGDSVSPPEATKGNDARQSTCSLALDLLCDRSEKKDLITLMGEQQNRMEQEIGEILKKREKVRLNPPSRLSRTDADLGLRLGFC